MLLILNIMSSIFLLLMQERYEKKLLSSLQELRDAYK
jgi:hypothetical protein